MPVIRASMTHDGVWVELEASDGAVNLLVSPSVARRFAGDLLRAAYKHERLVGQGAQGTGEKRLDGVAIQNVTDEISPDSFDKRKYDELADRLHAVVAQLRRHGRSPELVGATSDSTGGRS